MRPYTGNSQIAPNHFAVALTFVFAMVVIAALELNSQQLQKGVSVDLAPTTSAKPMPAADDPNAWIISVSADGHLWFGTTAVTPETLADKMIQTPRDRQQNLYIKADVRAPYSDVLKAVRAAHVVEFDSAILLTGQPASAQANGLVPPMGLQVWIENGALTAPSRPIDVDIAASQGSTVLKVNNQALAWGNLKDTIKQLSQGPTESVVRLRADGGIPFGDVARAADAARSAGAKVVLVMPKI